MLALPSMSWRAKSNEMLQAQAEASMPASLYSYSNLLLLFCSLSTASTNSLTHVGMEGFVAFVCLGETVFPGRSPIQVLTATAVA